jgi:hypothetical protein
MSQPHFRPCYTCGQHDDAPRIQAAAADGTIGLFHLQDECVPDSVKPLRNPDNQAHVDAGLKDDELRAAILATEQRDLGLDPTHANYIGDDAAQAVAE